MPFKSESEQSCTYSRVFLKAERCWWPEACPQLSVCLSAHRAAAGGTAPARAPLPSARSALPRGADRLPTGEAYPTERSRKPFKQTQGLSPAKDSECLVCSRQFMN